MCQSPRFLLAAAQSGHQCIVTWNVMVVRWRKLWIPRLQCYNALLQASPSSDWQVSACHVFIVTPVWQSTCDKVWRMTAPHYPAHRFLSDPSSVSVTRHVSWRCDNIEMFQICLPTKGVKTKFCDIFQNILRSHQHTHLLLVESTLFAHSVVSKDPGNHPSRRILSNWKLEYQMLWKLPRHL